MSWGRLCERRWRGDKHAVVAGALCFAAVYGAFREMMEAFLQKSPNENEPAAQEESQPEFEDRLASKQAAFVPKVEQLLL